MNIGMVLRGKFPPDIRIEKEARTLIKAGHKLYLLAHSFSNGEIEEVIDGIQVRNIYIHKNDLKKFINNVVFAYTFIDKNWECEIERFVRDFDIDVLHIHDLPLVGVGIRVGRKYGIPIVADLHENYPAAIQVTKGSKKRRWLLKRLRDFNWWSNYEKHCLPQVEHIIVVVEEAKERLIAEGILIEKVTIVSNTEDIAVFKSQKIDQDIIKRYNDDFIISYIGNFGPHRGIDCAIRAMQQIIKDVDRAKLLLIGGKVRHMKEMERLVKSLNLEEFIELSSWQSFEKVPTFIKASDICLVPHHRSGHTDTTIPHKLFQYMLMEKPVVVSDCRPLRRIVEETGCGLVFISGSADDLANKILQLWKDPHLMQKCGENGKAAVLKKYNWQITGKALTDLYSNL